MKMLENCRGCSSSCLKVDGDDESTKKRMPETCHVTNCGGGRGRDKGRGQGRGSRTAQRETSGHCGKYKNDRDIYNFEEHNLNQDRHMPGYVVEQYEFKKLIPARQNIEAPIQNFDLNA